MAFIRSYRPGDRDAVYDICVRTADAGGDARHLYPDNELVPSVFAGPYVELEPDLAFVLDNGEGRAVGYVVGVADTERFVAAYREKWLPVVGDRYPAPEGDGSGHRARSWPDCCTTRSGWWWPNSPRIPRICTSICCRSGRVGDTAAR